MSVLEFATRRPQHPIDPPVGEPAVAPDAGLRLLLSPAIGQGALDGAWWPRSRNLALEAADLVDHFPTRFERICRVVYSAPDWDAGSRRISVAGGFLNFGCFPSEDDHRVVVTSVAAPYGRVLQLLVVPPDWDNRTARHAMRIAASPTNTKSAATIFRESQDLDRADLLWHWDDDGGPASDAL